MEIICLDIPTRSAKDHEWTEINKVFKNHKIVKWEIIQGYDAGHYKSGPRILIEYKE